ncbi:MAG: hypothetical protein WKF29_10545, partial [Thermoleophilaceae bacterium]
RDRGALAESVSTRGFGQLRRIAERRARAERHYRLQQSEVRLAEIYERIPPWVFDGAPRDEAIDAELEVETELLVPDLDVVALLAMASEHGKVVIAVSDIYFSETQLRRLFAQPVLSDVHFDRIFTSSDHRTNKSGGLFEIALRSLGLEPEQMVHLGDSNEADILFPTKLGIAAFYFDRRPEPFATVADAEAPFMPDSVESVAEAGKVSGLTATRSKVLSRTHLAQVPDALQPYWHYGATVLGPVFAGFAEWVHEHCARTGARKVGCLMREGAFLGDLLRGANPYLGGALEAVPLWLNRDLCLRASIADASQNELERLLVRRSPPTVEGLCSTLGLALSTLPDWVSHAGTSLEDPVVRHNFIGALSSDDRVRGEIIRRSRALRERITAYVNRFCEDGPSDLTILDLGWGASIQSLLSEVLLKAGHPRHTVGLYLLTHEGAAEQVVQGIEVHGFLGEYGVPDGSVKMIMRAPELLEQVCMPPHGTQLDLREDFEPDLAPTNLPSLQLVEAEVVRKGVLAYQREWARYQTVLPGKVGRLSRARHLLRPILLRSVVAPTRQEVVAFGGWHHDEGQGSDRTDPIVDPADMTRLRYMSPQQMRELPVSELYWPFAAATLVDEHWAALMRLAACGQIDWEAFGAPLETGRFTVHGTGVDVPESTAIAVEPVRNRFGLSSVTGTIRAPFVQEIHIRPAERAAIIRMDWIRLRCYVQGEEKPIEIRYDASSGLVRWHTASMFVLGPGLYISYEGTGLMMLALAEVTRRVIFRVDVECAFAALPIAPVLPAAGRFADLGHAAAAFASLERSISWRITAPLRKAKRRLS